MLPTTMALFFTGGLFSSCSVGGSWLSNFSYLGVLIVGFEDYDHSVDHHGGLIISSGVKIVRYWNPLHQFHGLGGNVLKVLPNQLISLAREKRSKGPQQYNSL